MKDMNTDDYITSLEERIGRLEKLIVWILVLTLGGLVTMLADLGYTYRSKGQQISTEKYEVVKRK